MSLGTYGNFVVFIPGGAPPVPPYDYPMSAQLKDWIGPAGASPSMLVSPPGMVFAQGAVESTVSSFFVPWDYTPGNQMFLRMPYHTTPDLDPGHVAKMRLKVGRFGGPVATFPLDFPGASEADLSIPLTDSSGVLLGVPVTVDELLAVTMERDTVGDTVAADVTVILGGLTLSHRILS